MINFILHNIRVTSMFNIYVMLIELHTYMYYHIGDISQIRIATDQSSIK